ncbi:MAG: hypothetical protein P4L85_27165 [Paludisphaera borealis]|uniref:hypothetical protein n=1 Tax=Paludisphaera borealis TaxID=1387353 RepID=UPI00284B9073|nr:hypothetical protein [Paludisphaera borealis]MDR3623063.1 hypothetical protein [Paludisphaera borealis]
MPLKLNVGVSRKLGLPEFSSVGASCNVEVELDSSLLQSDLDGFHAQVRGAFTAACQAVDDELSRLQARPAPPVASHGVSAGGQMRRNGTAGSNRVATRSDGVGRPSKPASANQVRAIVTMARWRDADLAGLLRDEFGVDRPEDLSLADASRFIDRLKAVGET